MKWALVHGEYICNDGVSFFIRFFFDWVEITLIVLPLFAPIMQTLDFGDHLPSHMIVPWIAVLLAVNLQTSFLTPPLVLHYFI